MPEEVLFVFFVFSCYFVVRGCIFLVRHLSDMEREAVSRAIAARLKGSLQRRVSGG